MKKLIIIGAGGFALELLQIVKDTGCYEIVGLLDNDKSHWGTMVGDVPILGGDDDLPKWKAQGVENVAIAIANWKVRKQLFFHAADLGFKLPVMIHPNAYVASDVILGDGTVIYPGTVLMPSCKLGKSVLVNYTAALGHEVTVADFCNINPGAKIGGRIVINEGAYIGIGATILENRIIGTGARVGGGAVVTKNVEPNITVVGVPARPMEVTK